MKTTFDTETGTKTWHLEKWYQKAVYILGLVYSVLILLFFLLEILSY